MNIFPRSLALLAALGLAAPAGAQVFAGADPADAASALAAKAVAGGAAAAKSAPAAPTAAPGVEFAKSITCAESKANPIGKVKLYTDIGFLPGAASADGSRPYGILAGGLHADETRLNDYGGVSIKDGIFHYDAWSCDSVDYWLSAKLADLMRAGPGPKTSPLVFHARVEIRGHVEDEADVACTANW